MAGAIVSIKKVESGISSFHFLPVFLFTPSARLLLYIFAEEVIQHAGEFHREDELGGWAGADGLECFEILQGHGLLVN
jgi:hypothetical protein